MHPKALRQYTVVIYTQFKGVVRQPLFLFRSQHLESRHRPRRASLYYNHRILNMRATIWT